MPQRRIATVALLLLMACAPSLLYAQTFAEQFNPSGDPIGGGPGYSQIPNASAADHVLGAPSTAADLLALAKSYYDEAAGQTVTPASAAAEGTLIYVDPAAALDLDGYDQITFNDGVTLASNRGESLGDGTYAPGALLKRRSMWPNTDGGPQLEALFMAWNGGRLTGFRAQGPFDLRGPNASKTRDWLGGATFFGKRGISGTFELDNNEIYAWPDFAVWWYHTTTGDAMHHNWVHHNRQVGWGYGLYPGRPFGPGDEEVLFLTDYNLFQENKHSVDHNSARPSSWHNLVWKVRGNVFLGRHGQSIIHGHVNKVGGCSYSGWKTDYIRNMIVQPGEPKSTRDVGLGLPPEGGYLNVKDLYLDRATRANTYVSKYISGDRVDPQDPNYDPDWDASCSAPHGSVTVDIHTDLGGATLPTEGSVPSATTLTEGQALTLDLSGSSDPDGHAITHHEILWGDGKSATDPAHREVVYGASAQHTYAESGTYIVRVTAFNEHGIPSRVAHHEITVEPAAEGPLFVAFVGANWPGGEGQNWPGYYSARLLVNGHVAMDWRDVASFSGYERIAWDAAPIDADATFELTMELRTDQTIADPDGTEPGRVEFHVDRFYLFGRDGALYDEDLFLSGDDVGVMITTWGGGGSSSLFDRHDRAIGPGYGHALTVPQQSWTGHTAGDRYAFTTNAKGLNPSPTPAPTDAPPIASLLSWHPMEEAGATATRADAHSTVDLEVADGRPVGGAVPGVQGNAVDLGPSGRLDTKNSAPSFPLDLSEDFSVVSWVYVPSAETEAGIAWAAANGDAPLKLVTVPWRGRYQFSFYAGAAKRYVENNDLAHDTWQMVTLRYDASARTVRLRVDGGPDAEEALSAPIDIGNGGDFWRVKGGGLRVDEQSVWQRYLSDADLDWLYNGGGGRTYAELGEGPPSGAASHSIELRQGWNLISSYVAPEPSSLEAVFADVLSDVALVKDEAGKAFLPGEGINRIGDWDPLEAYMVYARQAVTLRLSGTSLSGAPPAVPLEQGWNLVPYLREASLPIEEALGSISEHVVLVKDYAGAAWIPEYGINHIGLMQPQQGYKVYMAQPAELTYTPSGSSEPRPALTRGPAPSAPLKAPGVSSSAVVLVQAEGLREGQRVSAWVPERGRIGEGVVQHGGTVAVTLRGDESATAGVVEGARSNDAIVLNVHPGGRGEPRRLAISSLSDALSGQRLEGPLSYRSDGFYIAQAEELPQAFRLGQNYPNPFRRSTTIAYSLPEKAKVKLVVYDALGRRVATLVDEEQDAGTYRAKFNAAQLSSGIYFYRLRAGDFTDDGRMVLAK